MQVLLAQAYGAPGWVRGVVAEAIRVGNVSEGSGGAAAPHPGAGRRRALRMSPQCHRSGLRHGSGALCEVQVETARQYKPHVEQLWEMIGQYAKRATST